MTATANNRISPVAGKARRIMRDFLADESTTVMEFDWAGIGYKDAQTARTSLNYIISTLFPSKSEEDNQDTSNANEPEKNNQDSSDTSEPQKGKPALSVMRRGERLFIVKD